MPKTDASWINYGHWIPRTPEREYVKAFYECSCCECLTDMTAFHTYNFCPNCGANMMQDDEEEK